MITELAYENNFNLFVNRSRLAHEAASRHHKITGLVIGILATLLLAGGIGCCTLGIPGNLAIGVPGVLLVVAGLAIGIKSISSVSKGYSRFAHPEMSSWNDDLAETITHDTIGNVSESNYGQLVKSIELSPQPGTPLSNDARWVNPSSEIAVFERDTLLNLFTHQTRKFLETLTEMPRDYCIQEIKILIRSDNPRGLNRAEVEGLIAHLLNRRKITIFDIETIFLADKPLYEILLPDFFEKLEVLDIKQIGPELDRILDLIRHCPNIRSIFIPKDAGFEFLIALEKYPNLIEFDLSDCRQFDPTWLENFPHPERVRSLNLSGCSLDSLQSLRRFDHLARLDINRTITNNPAILEPLRNLIRLEELRATACDWLTGEALAYLSATLQSLDVSDCRNFDPHHLPDLPFLRILLVKKTPVVDLNWLIKTPRLQKLDVSMTPLIGDCLSSLVHVPGLTELSLRGCVSVKPNSIRHILLLNELRDLDIRFCECFLHNQNGLDSINKHPTLQVVRVLKNQDLLNGHLTNHGMTTEDLRIGDLTSDLPP